MKSNRTVAVLVLVSLVLLAVDLRDGGGVLQRGASAVFSPLQAAGAAVVRPIGGFFSSIGDLGTLREENQRLREEVATLRQSAVSIADLERQNQELLALLGATQAEELVTTVGRVIATPPDDTSWSVLIDAGAAQGVAVGMAVLTQDGFVGRVSEVTARYARVLLASSPDAGFAVRVADNGEVGLLSGQGSEPFRLELFDTDVEVPLDAEIVTQSSQGSLVPGGLPIGVLERPPNGITAGLRFLAVRPYVDFRSLTSVLVVLNASEPPEDLEPGAQIENPQAPRPEALAPAPTAAPLPPLVTDAPPVLPGAAQPPGATAPPTEAPS